MTRIEQALSLITLSWLVPKFLGFPRFGMFELCCGLVAVFFLGALRGVISLLMYASILAKI